MSGILTPNPLVISLIFSAILSYSRNGASKGRIESDNNTENRATGRNRGKKTNSKYSRIS